MSSVAGDVTDAGYIDGYWIQGKDDRIDGHAFYKSRDLVHWARVPRIGPKTFSGCTGGLAFDDDANRTAVVVYPPCGGNIVAAVAKDHSLAEWKRFADEEGTRNISCVN